MMDIDALMATAQPPVMDIYAFASALGVLPEETAAPMASSCDSLLRTGKELVDLPLELLRLVVAAIVKDRDAVSLERLGGTCRMLQALSRDVAAWHSLLLAHFDGELPPLLRLAPSAGSAAPASGSVSFKDLVIGLTNDQSLSDAVKHQISVLGDAYNTQDKAASFSKLKDLVGKERIKQIMFSLKTGAPATADCTDPRAALQETMRFARALIHRQREKCVLQLPLGMPLSVTRAKTGDKDLDAWHASAHYRAWIQKTDAGARTGMMPPPPEHTIISYGKFVRVTELSMVAEDSTANLTLEEATISTWLEYVPAEGLNDDGRYAVLANWLDAKVTGLAEPAAASRPTLDLEADVRELVAKHGLEGQAVRRMLAAARGEAVEAIEDEDEDEDDGGSWRLTPKRTESPIASTKVLAGLYGGLFSFDGGSYYNSNVELMCLADDQRIAGRTKSGCWVSCKDGKHR